MSLSEELGDWLIRDLPNVFFENAGKHNMDECKKLFLEIPEDYKELAFAIIQLATKSNFSCAIFRNMLYLMYKNLQEKNIDLKLPYYWYADGIMVEPEWIVRITNGIIGWECDKSVKECNMENECRYHKKL